ETRSSWTAYFDNGVRGGEPAPVLGYLCSQLKCRAIAVCARPHTWQPHRMGVSGAVSFDLLSPDDKAWLNYNRSILVAWERGGWRMQTQGAIQPFETPESYNARRVVDRFTDETLEEYCRYFEIELFHPAFYGPTGWIIVDRTPIPPNFPSLSLSDARLQA